MISQSVSKSTVFLRIYAEFNYNVKASMATRTNVSKYGILLNGFVQIVVYLPVILLSVSTEYL